MERWRKTKKFGKKVQYKKQRKKNNEYKNFKDEKK